MIGTKLHQRYDILSLLSHRQDRQTYLAFDTQQNSQVVVKVLPFTYGTSWKGVARFERETNLLQHLSHPSIPQCIDSFEIDLPSFKGFAWVQPYLDALSLKELIGKGKTFSEQELKQIATDILKILTFLHEQNPPVIHRDVKPSNILISGKIQDQYEKLYLIDFDTVQPFASVAEGTVTVAGTFGYGAPEQFYGEAVPASDLYGLGMTLIYLITGVNPSQLPIRHEKIQFEANQLSSSFRRWLNILTQSDVDGRFGSASEAMNALRQGIYQPKFESSCCRKSTQGKLWLSKSDERLLIKVMPKKPIIPNWFSLPFLIFGINKILNEFFFYFNFYAIAEFLFGWTAFFHLHSIFFMVFVLNLLVRIWVIREFLLPAFGYMQIELTQQEINLSLRWAFFKEQCSVEISDAQQIRQVISFPNASNTKRKQKITSDLQLYADNQVFELTKRSGLLRRTQLYKMTLEEQNWIASELSDWLHIPVKKTERFAIR
ncbi:MAG: protein kinase [Phormidesmis priestleyi Ana]|uniref:Protein kinase n=1 Tax=Phormidesmis priestleyi Ana TaxID=1666911 RepID=A0A0P7YM11_9CYAN|nr:MAG: protein kinase [Phormidesmis priestleyi Ana]